MVDEPDALAALETRRSVGVTMLGVPGPDAAGLSRMLAIAARVPDHGALEPWRFILLECDGRAAAGALLGECYAAEATTMEPAKRAKFAGIVSRVFTHAPVVVTVVSRPDGAAAVPAWEQELSAGAVCMNLLHAARALGFSAVWLTGWAAYSPGAAQVLGLREGERVAGFVHIGTAREPPAERRRPDMAALTTFWRPD